MKLDPRFSLHQQPYHFDCLVDGKECVALIQYSKVDGEAEFVELQLDGKVIDCSEDDVDRICEEFWRSHE